MYRLIKYLQQEVSMQEEQNSTGFHEFGKSTDMVGLSKIGIFFAIIVLLGAGSGFLFSKIFQAKSGAVTVSQNGKLSSIQKGMVLGSNDTATFKDTAEGVLQAGGIGDEGQYHLVRPGGDSQNVYVTSSIVDLSQFVGKKIKVNGQTQAAKKAGWLMDVGRVEVLE